MSSQISNGKEVDSIEQFNEENGEQNKSDEGIEIYIENDYTSTLSTKPTKKKQKNEHRKSKKRKYEDISSDENLSLVKEKHKEKLENKKSKLKKKKKKGSKHKKLDLGEFNGDIYIKEEVLSENEQTMFDESDEDVPLSMLEKKPAKQTEKKLKVKKTYAISNSADVSEVEGKVKKLKIKKVKIKKVKMDMDEFATDCTACNKTFDTNLKYKAHMRKVHGTKPFVCVICSKAFFKEKDLLNHHNIHTGQNPYCCVQCGKMFKSDGTLKKHIRIFHADDIKKYACTMCPKVLSSATCLEEHERLHTGENPWSCNLCGKLFARERDLKLHSNLHQELWKCDICQRCFITSFKLKEHYRSHTGETPYECDKCDRKFARLADYRYHVGTHLGLKPFSCELCDMKFTTSSSMKRHLVNMHQQGPLDFKCHICPKAFNTQMRLNSHIKNHENKKRYNCHLCDATRSSQSELQRHLILHSGEFRCDTCNVNCSSAERLAAHVARHDLTGKPYACFVCSLGYQTSQTLNKHLATVHKNQDVPKVAPQHLCTLCGNVFDHKDKLNRHLKDDHVVLAVGEIHSLVNNGPYSHRNTESYAKVSEKTQNDQDIAGKLSSSELIENSPLLLNRLTANVEKVSSSNAELKKDIQKSPEININSIAEENEDFSDKDQEILPVEYNELLVKKDNEDVSEVQDSVIKSVETSLPKSTSDNPKIMGNIEKNTPVSAQLSVIKSEEDPCKDSVSPQSDGMENSAALSSNKIHKNAVEVIQNLARKNIESYLHKQEWKKNTELNSDVKPTPLSNCERENLLKDFKEDSHSYQTSKLPDVADIIHEPQPPHQSQEVKMSSEVCTTNVIQKAAPMQSHVKNTDKDFSPHIITTKKEIENSVLENMDERCERVDKLNYPEISQFNSLRDGSNLTLPTASQTSDYFDDFSVKDLSTTALEGKQKTPHKYDFYDMLYSKPAQYNDSLPGMSQHSKHFSQSVYKNINDPLESYNQLQQGIQQVSNPWFLPNKIACDTELASKQNLSRSYAEPRQKDTKVGHMDMFQSQLHNFDQYTMSGRQKPQVDHVQDFSLQFAPPIHKESHYDKKTYSASGLDHKNYFDDYSQKQYHDDRKRTAQQHSVPSETDSKQSSRGYPTFQSHFNNEPLNIREHINASDQLNYYNPHSFATMANTPQLFQNFREIHHRMLSSGVPGYSHHSRQHLLPGMEVTNQRIMNSTPSPSLYNQMGPHSHLDSPPLSRHGYSDVPNPNITLPSYHSTRQSGGESTDDGQGKDDGSGPFELRVSVN